MKPSETNRHVLATTAVLLALLGAAGAFAMQPNSLISRGKTVKASNGTASALNDGVYGTGVFTFSANSWFAIDLGAGPASVFLSWNTTSYTWSDKIADPHRNDCRQTPSYPVDYTIRTSANSTDGVDGDWATAATVTGNSVSGRGHRIEFTGMRWVKMTVSASNRTNDKIDEVEVFNTSAGAEDTWFFAGTSISANAYKSFPALESFPARVGEAHDGFTPAMIRGGIPCITSAHFVRDISMYLEAAGNCRYWAIEMGTNDAWGGTNSNVAAFKSNLQSIIDSCKARDIRPIISTVLATDSSKAGWQVHPDYLKAVRELTESNGLVEGPDYFAAFKANPAYLNSDGVHPGSEGAAAMHRLWAEKMDGLYEASAAGIRPLQAEFRNECRSTAIAISPGVPVVSFHEPGTVSVFTLRGRLLQRATLRTAGDFTLTRCHGCLLLRFEAFGGGTTTRFHPVGQ